MPSLLTAHDCTSHIHLIIGSNPLAASRISKSLEVGAIPKLICPAIAELNYSLKRRIDEGEVQWIQKEFEEEDLKRGREEIGGWVDAVFVTEKGEQSEKISLLCRRNRVPVNVADSSSLCTFTLLSTHTDGPLQIGVTTSGKGCKLSSRIRREIASSLPPTLGEACNHLGTIRTRLQSEDISHADSGIDLEEDDGEQAATFNKLVLEADVSAQKTRRIRWLSQICEYWPLRRLATITPSDIDGILESYSVSHDPSTAPSTTNSKKGRIILAGSGPGHPDLLTRATHKAILTADLILADKLVPSGVLDLIPRRTPVHIARKFPGNAEKAQEELLSLGLAALQQGKTVLRLKQGDPYIYGRGGEEYLYFESQGFGGRVQVLPGVTSALSAPLFAAIPATQRAVADQVLVCTGTGRKGKPTEPPAYVSSQTVVFLMALHRIEGLVADLTTHAPEREAAVAASAIDAASEADSKTPELQVNTARPLWPLSTPCAVIERASCPDQRVIRTTLEYVVRAIAAEGSRPPGLLVLGRACEVLRSATEKEWAVEEGFRGLDVDELGLGVRADIVRGDSFGRELVVG